MIEEICETCDCIKSIHGYNGWANNCGEFNPSGRFINTNNGEIQLEDSMTTKHTSESDYYPLSPVTQLENAIATARNLSVLLEASEEKYSQLRVAYIELGHQYHTFAHTFQLSRHLNTYEKCDEASCKLSRNYLEQIEKLRS